MEASESLWHGAGCMVASGSLSMQLEVLKKYQVFFRAEVFSFFF
jgi:hypothetical protein